MKKLFLTSSGIPQEKIGLFISYVGKPAKDIKLAFIGTAADPEKDKSFVKQVKEELSDEIGIGLIVDIDLKKLKPKTIKKELSPFDVIFVNGGNTFYLLDWMRKSGFTKVANELFENTNRVYVGVSAGSLVAGPDISPAGWKPEWDTNLPELTDFTGLNLVDFIIIPHYLREDKPLIDSMRSKTPYRIVELEDGKLIYVKKENI